MKWPRLRRIPRKRTQLMRRGVLLLVAGAIINVAVAWMCVLNQESPGMPWWTPPAQKLWDRYARPEYHAGIASYDERTNAALGADFLMLQAEIPLPKRTSFTNYVDPHMLVTRAGWPLSSLECMNDWGPLPQRTAWGIPISPRNPNVAWVCLLPYRPMLLGFTFNTAVFGGLFFCSVYAPFRWVRLMRETIRRNRGCCYKCGYDLKHQTMAQCSECGAEDMKESVPSSPWLDCALLAGCLVTGAGLLIVGLFYLPRWL